MRRLILVAGAVTGLACASIQAPPGGPQRKEPPAITAVTPESGAVNVTDKNVVFSFDAIVNDRAGRNGSLAGTFIVSPNDGATVVNWKRDRIEVRPKRGFSPNTAYSVTMLPGIADLNNNAIRETRVVTFSTGPTIPAFAVHGRVFDWASERIATDARVDVVRLPDSLTFTGITDSTGQFRVGPLDTGTYHVRAMLDNNRNGTLDPSELWDSARVTVRAESPFVELRAAARDTFGPRLLTVATLDSMRLNASFDRPLDPAQPLNAELFRIQTSDSSDVPIGRVLTQARIRAERAVQDSIKRDSLAKLDTTTRAAPPPPRGAVAAPPPKPSIPAPAREFVIELGNGARLVPGDAYRITARSARSITGVTRTSDRIITASQTDTTRTTPPRP